MDLKMVGAAIEMKKQVPESRNSKTQASSSYSSQFTAIPVTPRNQKRLWSHSQRITTAETAIKITGGKLCLCHTNLPATGTTYV